MKQSSWLSAIHAFVLLVVWSLWCRRGEASSGQKANDCAVTVPLPHRSRGVRLTVLTGRDQATNSMPNRSPRADWLSTRLSSPVASRPVVSATPTPSGGSVIARGPLILASCGFALLRLLIALPTPPKSNCPACLPLVRLSLLLSHNTHLSLVHSLFLSRAVLLETHGGRLPFLPSSSVFFGFPFSLRPFL